jgi:copper transport protein
VAIGGHGMTAAPRWLAIAAMALHAVTIGFWAGSLWPLLRCLDRPAAEAAQTVARFSKRAVAAVATLVVAGLVLAILQLGGTVAALASTPYGQLLLLKLALVALVLCLAAYNKLRLTPALAHGEAQAAERLARSIRLEIAGIGLIVAVTALLSQTPPPRTLAATEQGGAALHAGHHRHAASTPQTVTLQSRGYTAVVTLAPARAGRNRLAVALQGPDGAPFDALEASAAFSLASAGIEPLSAPLRPVGAGRYELTTDALIQPGAWRLGLAVLISDFERVSFDADLTVDGP